MPIATFAVERNRAFIQIHQGPMEGIDNWFYARVRNRGSSSAQHFRVTFTVKPWVAKGFIYPADFIPCTAAIGGYERVPDEEKIVSVKWPAASVHLAMP